MTKETNKKELKNNYHYITLTDIQVHVQKPRKPLPWYRAIIKALKNKKPGRFYSTEMTTKKDGSTTVSFSLPPKIQREMEETEKAGKIVKLLVPKDGLPIHAGPDTIEKIEAEKRKHRKTLDKYNS